MWEYGLQWAAAVAGIVAGLLWLRACFVLVVYKPVVDPGGWTAAAIIHEDDKGRRIDPFATAARANRWNAWAAGVTSAAALLQAASLVAHRLGA